MKKFGFLIFLFLSGCDSYHALTKWQTERDVREKVAVLAHLDVAWESSTKPLARALAYYRAEGANKIIILGDPTKNGYPNQRKVFEEVWKRSFVGVTPPERILATNEYTLSGITFTGEGRYPLTDLLCVHPKDGRRVNAGSMHGFVVSGVFDKPDARMAGKTACSAQGLLVLIRSEGMEIRRLDFSETEASEVGAPWTVDSTGMILSEADSVPKFWNDTEISVTPGYDGKGNRQYVVRWPPVLSIHTGARAFSYDVSVGKEVVRRVQSPGFFLPEERDGVAVRCVIPASELGEGEPRFGVTPVSSLGQRGPTVWSR